MMIITHNGHIIAIRYIYVFQFFNSSEIKLSESARQLVNKPLKSVQRQNNPYKDEKVIDSCSIFGMMDQNKKLFAGNDIIEASASMNQRANGLGSGYAVYGLYPKYWNNYAFHIMYDDKEALDWGSKFIESNFDIIFDEEIPMDIHGIHKHVPIMRRYFTNIDLDNLDEIKEDEYLVNKCLEMNTSGKGAYVFSSGKNMGVFKGVGWPQEIAKIFRLDEYKGYLWLSHSRFPTNSRAWWGGAHPFAHLESTVVHNGEISSYGTNRRFLEMKGYRCTFQTDTEIFALALDYLQRKHQLPVEIIAKIFAPPLWKDIEKMSESERNLLRRLRITYDKLLMNGPFSIIFANHGLMVGLADRLKLRPIIAARRKDMLLLSSEEAAIIKILPDIDDVHHPKGGEPVIARCHEGFAS
jgi:glutamate synthase domain-containing protein 1|tara:strand:- start:2414 stop:3643 length:1230 start_codon:yes stop_codon:yes gene_type:complete